MSTSSFITVKNALEQFAANHLAIKRYKTSFFEQIDNFSSADNTFPILYVVPSDVTFEQYVDRFFFRIYVVDILQKDRSNESAILNDTLLTLRDLYNWLKIADNGLNVLSTARAIPVNNFLVDYTAGWYLDVEVEGSAESNDCSIPFTDNFTLTGYTCDFTYATKFLTCETLEECAVIIDLQNQIDAIVVSADTFVVNGSYDNPSGTLTLVRNDGDVLNITGFTTGATGGSDIYVTGGTFNQGTETLTLSRNDNQSVVITGFTSGTDIYVTGGTYSNGSVIFTNNTGGTFSVTGFVSADTFVTNFGYDDANTFTIRQNNDQPDLNVTINTVTGLTTDYFDFNTGATVANQTARIKWNDTDGTLDLGLKGGNVTLQIGQEQVVRVVNKTGSNLLESNYQVVRVRTAAEGGAQGQRLAVLLAQANTKANHTGVLGLVTENIDNNQEGFITTFGNVRGLNTTGSLQGETWSDGDVIWLSETTAGGLTNIEPTTHPVAIGYVVYAHVNNGKIFVKVQEGVDVLGELHDVNVSGATNGQVLTYSAATQTWVPTTPSSGGEFTGGTVNGPTNFTNGLSANTFSATTYLGLPLDVFVTGGTFNSNTLTLSRNDNQDIIITGFTSSGTSGVDVFVTGGTYNAGTAVFTNNTGGTFSVSGFETGNTNVAASTVVGTFPKRRDSVGKEIIPSVDRLYVCATTDNIVEIFEASSGIYIGAISSGVTGAYNSIYCESRNEVWITNNVNGTIRRYDPATFTYLGGDITGSGTGGMEYVEISPTKMYIANWISNTITEINPTTLAVVATITAVSLGVTTIRAITYVNNPSSLHNGYLAGTCITQSEFYAINTATNGVAITGNNFGSTLGSPPTGVVYNPINDRYYVSTNQSNQVRIFSPNTTTTILFENYIYTSLPQFIKCNRSTGKIYVVNFAQNNSNITQMSIQCIGVDGND